ncbi:hypothetical protein LPB72_16265 [Hydrogenophaga crassostreae]|uniref:Thymidine phosphorylase n=1 Tax=Hydrogenophaga crassostreae TaxID=1763535 RepID=A0A167H7Y7_9BURK|nr:DUF1631 family protein [Hydrogenophaga crassostreae]AOW12592.1 hypothetical protein LPB072_06780 [Hydrogenophaga crassostreae]OAD40463.1 hypothetical protein LPB72_16265 [Hydrogenophaga crassostreae]
MDTHKLIRSGVANDPGKQRPTLQHCLEATLSIADSMIDEMLERLALVVDPESVTPTPVELKGVDLKEVARWLDQADAIKHTWSTELRQVFYHGEGRDVDVHVVVRFDDLRLLDDHQIDASIEFAMVEQILAGATVELLPRLNSQVSNLMGWLTVQPDLNPIKPAAYARALRAVFVAHLSDAQQRKLLMVPVASILGESLRQVYREVIQWLMANGVQPLEPQAHSLQPDRAQQSAVGRTMLTLGRLRQLLAGDLNEQVAGGPTYMQTVPASLSVLEDMDLIEPLMKRLRERPSPSPDQPPVAELPVVSGHNLGRLLGQEVVRLMLENLTQDERLLPAIRQQIGLLEPSLIRLSQAEPRFFSDRQHPARQLLESMTQRSLGFLGHHDEGFADFLKSVKGAVKSIDRVEATEEKYARLLKRLRRRWEDDDARKNQRRAEAARALLHAEQRQLLAERLSLDFQQRMQDKAVPDFVQRFVCGPWSQAVAEAQLTESAGGDEPLEGVTDDLIWSVQAVLIRRDVDRLARLVPRLLSQIRQGLQRIDYPVELIGHFFDALVNLHEKAFETPTLTPETVPGEPAIGSTLTGEEGDFHNQNSPEATKPLGNDTFWMADREAADAGFVAGEAGESVAALLEGGTPREQELSAGAWVNLKTQGEWVRAQLTWTSPRGGLFMFISASGMAHSMTRRTLDRLLGAGSLQIVSRGGVVEGALDAVAQHALRNAQNDNGDPVDDGSSNSTGDIQQAAP